MARGNLAAARGAAARRGKSPTSEVDVRPDFHPVGTATEGSTLVRDLTRPLKDSLRSRPARAGVARSARLNPRPPKSNRESCETHNARSEEHTSELQSRLHLVCRLLLEKKIKWIGP